MRTLKNVLFALVLLVSVNCVAFTGGDGEKVVDVINNKLEVVVDGKLATVVSVEKYSGVAIKLFEVDGEHITTKKTSNEFDFTQLESGTYIVMVEGFAPATIEIK